MKTTACGLTFIVSTTAGNGHGLWHHGYVAQHPLSAGEKLDHVDALWNVSLTF